MSQQEDDAASRISFGVPVYTEDGTQVGTVQGFDEHGVYVSAEEGIEGMSVTHQRVGKNFGEGELMWRCWGCGEMGRIDEDIPDECPGCATGREDLYYWTED